ncbi:hypothetical protein HMPREF1022_01128 [Desulfovibrio sp. 6_1_46AFAA]|uniref:hypothetical protein n=1 Tax=Desulfovibrio sp. 6_1_46AFAA TaxID=665942 RepID=UPI0001E12AE5|nr:hypothetical protein [Desulfovibrio sp. 6_1_46AFAA]EFL85379.1 hypothetical protein HMPREF0326_02131 [Desulfovibrio sp. 3_1_syn3]EGW51860.1 hypothetical protein HMPREF1022_01128 [Desulfovibrio sp. 6_1_46AFAA]
MDSACTAVQSLDVSHRFSHDNLHIRFNSRFDPPQASVLINLLQRYYQSCKRIFIDVREVEQPNPVAAAALKAAFLHADYEPQQIVFKGNSGFALAVSGNKVLLVPEKKPEGHVCRGNCAHCRCGHKKARSESKTA